MTSTTTTIQALRLLQLNACIIDALLEITQTADGLDFLPEEHIRIRIRASEVLFLSMGDQYFGEVPFYETWSANIAGWWKRLETLVLLKKKKVTQQQEVQEKSKECSCSSFSPTTSSPSKDRPKVQMVDASTSTSTDDPEPLVEQPSDHSNDQLTEADKSLQWRNPRRSRSASRSIELPEDKTDKVDEIEIETETEAKANADELETNEHSPFTTAHKASVKSKVEAEMAALPPLSSDADIVGLRTLLLALSALIKDRRVGDPFKGRLLAKYLLTRLPTSMVEQYQQRSKRYQQKDPPAGCERQNSWHPNKVALLQLRHYLADHLVGLFAPPTSSLPPATAQMLAITAASEADKEDEQKEEEQVEIGVELSPEEFRQTIREDLAQLQTMMMAELVPLPSVASADDLSAMEELLATVASVRQLLHLFSSQSQLLESSSSSSPAFSLNYSSPRTAQQAQSMEEALYEVLAGKLPTQLRLQEETTERTRQQTLKRVYHHQQTDLNGGRGGGSASTCPPEKQLSTLSRTLARLISDYYRRKDEERRRQLAAIVPPGLVVVPRLFNHCSSASEHSSSNSSSYYSVVQPQQLHFCTYCKCLGHRTIECALPKAMLCYRCFEIGHKAKNCPTSEAALRQRGPSTAAALSPPKVSSSSPTLRLTLEGGVSKGRTSLMATKKMGEEVKGTAAVRLPNGQLFGPKEGANGRQLCLECITFGHRTSDCRQVICFCCKQPGHMRSGCLQPKKTGFSASSSFSSSSSTSTSTQVKDQESNQE